MQCFWIVVVASAYGGMCIHSFNSVWHNSQLFLHFDLTVPFMKHFSCRALTFLFHVKLQSTLMYLNAYLGIYVCLSVCASSSNGASRSKYYPQGISMGIGLCMPQLALSCLSCMVLSLRIQLACLSWHCHASAGTVMSQLAHSLGVGLACLSWHFWSMHQQGGRRCLTACFLSFTCAATPCLCYVCGVTGNTLEAIILCEGTLFAFGVSAWRVVKYVLTSAKLPSFIT